MSEAERDIVESTHLRELLQKVSLATGGRPTNCSAKFGRRPAGTSLKNRCVPFVSWVWISAATSTTGAHADMFSAADSANEFRQAVHGPLMGLRKQPEQKVRLKISWGEMTITGVFRVNRIAAGRAHGGDHVARFRHGDSRIVVAVKVPDRSLGTTIGKAHFSAAGARNRSGELARIVRDGVPGPIAAH